MRLIYLPGMSGDGNFWRPIAKQLPPTWEHILLDWPGLGGNPPSSGVRGFEDLVELVVETLVRPAVLVAQSMGGVVAVRAALRARAMVSHLVLSATSGGIDVKALGASDWRPIYRSFWPSAPEWAFEHPADLSAELSSLEIPTLLLWATRDQLSPVGVGQRLAQVLPQARLQLFDSDDHMFATSNPDGVAAAIERHLTCAEARRPPGVCG